MVKDIILSDDAESCALLTQYIYFKINDEAKELALSRGKMKVINAFKLQHFINTSGQGENIKVMKKVIKTEEFSYHENIAKLKKLLQRRENTNIPMKNLLQELKAPPVHHEGKRCPPTCNQQKKCQYIRKVFIEKIKTPTSLQRLSSCDPPTLENKIFMYNINITYNISLSVFCNSRSCKRREILFQKS